MRYSDSLRYLNSFLNLERIIYHPKNRLWNLKRMDFLLKWFGRPEKQFFPVLIAGTKGKGSTGFFLEAILKANKIPVGFYSSPHLEDPRERIRIRGKTISKNTWSQTVRSMRRTLAAHKLPAGYGDFTYFEIMTILAMLVFRSAKVSIGIFEIGMGGRLDATNCLDAKLAILTPIHLDHEAFLGDTVAQIAYEKAGIIRRGGDVIVSPQSPEAMRVIKKQINIKHALLWKIKPLTHFKVGLLGDFQKTNAGAAYKAAKILDRKYGFAMSEAESKVGLQSKEWPGRIELFKGRPDIMIDGAHNPASTRALVSNLKKLFRNRDRLLIFGVSKDKKVGEMLKTLSGFFSRIVLTPIPNPRSQEINVLLEHSRKFFTAIYPTGNIREALSMARSVADPRGLIVATGSFYLIGELRKMIKK